MEGQNYLTSLMGFTLSYCFHLEGKGGLGSGEEQWEIIEAVPFKADQSSLHGYCEEILNYESSSHCLKH